MSDCERKCFSWTLLLKTLWNRGWLIQTRCQWWPRFQNSHQLKTRIEKLPDLIYWSHLNTQSRKVSRHRCLSQARPKKLHRTYWHVFPLKICIPTSPQGESHHSWYGRGPWQKLGPMERRSQILRWVLLGVTSWPQIWAVSTPLMKMNEHDVYPGLKSKDLVQLAVHVDQVENQEFVSWIVSGAIPKVISCNF